MPNTFYQAGCLLSGLIFKWVRNLNVGYSNPHCGSVKIKGRYSDPAADNLKRVNYNEHYWNQFYIAWYGYISLVWCIKTFSRSRYKVWLSASKQKFLYFTKLSSFLEHLLILKVTTDCTFSHLSSNEGNLTIHFTTIFVSFWSCFFRRVTLTF